MKRNVPRPAILPSGSIYDSFASSSSSSINGHSRAGGLSTSGSVSGMSLYIPPYVQPSRVSTPQPPPPISAPPAMAPSNSFADLGVPPGHRHRQSMTVRRLSNCNLGFGVTDANQPDSPKSAVLSPKFDARLKQCHRRSQSALLLIVSHPVSQLFPSTTFIFNTSAAAATCTQS